MIPDRLWQDQNVGRVEQWVSVIAGGALAAGGAAFGLARRSWAGAGLVLAGGALLHRGITRHCAVKSAFESSGPVRLQRTITVRSKSPQEVYEFWRNLENLPGVIPDLESVQRLDGRRSHWVLKGPAGKRIEWDAEITNERPGRHLEFRSLPGSAVDLAGIVRFKRKQGQGTKIHLDLQYTIPGGAAGEKLAQLLRERPEARVDAGLQSIQEALNRA